MANLTERIRTIARDVQEGDSDGSLRADLDSLSASVSERFESVDNNIQQLLEDVATLKRQQGN